MPPGKNQQKLDSRETRREPRLKDPTTAGDMKMRTPDRMLQVEMSLKGLSFEEMI